MGLWARRRRPTGCTPSMARAARARTVPPQKQGAVECGACARGGRGARRRTTCSGPDSTWTRQAPSRTDARRTIRDLPDLVLVLTLPHPACAAAVLHLPARQRHRAWRWPRLAVCWSRRQAAALPVLAAGRMQRACSGRGSAAREDIQQSTPALGVAVLRNTNTSVACARSCCRAASCASSGSSKGGRRRLRSASAAARAARVAEQRQVRTASSARCPGSLACLPTPTTRTAAPCPACPAHSSTSFSASARSLKRLRCSRSALAGTPRTRRRRRRLAPRLAPPRDAAVRPRSAVPAHSRCTSRLFAQLPQPAVKPQHGVSGPAGAGHPRKGGGRHVAGACCPPRSGPWAVCRWPLLALHRG